MNVEMPAELQRLIRAELHGDTGVGGRNHWWERPAVLAVDATKDIAAALLWQRGGVVTLALFERGGSRWRVAGGGGAEGVRRRELTTKRPSVRTNGPAHVLTTCGSVSARRAPVPGTARRSWISAYHLRLASEVSYLDVGGRRVEVRAHGRVMAVWETAQPPLQLAGTRPRIAACRGDGTVLSELGPGDVIDSASLHAIASVTRSNLHEWLYVTHRRQRDRTRRLQLSRNRWRLLAATCRKSLTPV
jgi:hypothetical protein